MFAVVANGIQTICRTQRALDRIIAIYPYPKFAKCKTIEEARAWIMRNTRVFDNMNHHHYGNTSSSGYATIRYEITGNSIIYNIDTKRVGYIRVPTDDKDVAVDSRFDKLNVVISNVVLRNDLITHHIIAIRRILKLLGDYIDVDIVIPDISIFLAITKYSGRNYIILGLQNDIAERVGALSLTIEEEVFEEEEVEIDDNRGESEKVDLGI